MSAATPSSAPEDAVVARLDLAPTGSGPLDGLRFGVKDLIDIAGSVTGGGNPTWRDTHPPAPAHAVCVEQLLRAGARCVAKTLTDQLAFSLRGENYHHGTPPNPRAPNRVPGGSSSGSASAVACGLVDFALGTDTGGSVRVPASYCGIYGLRPSHGVVSVAGVMPFAPTFDTVGVLAPNAEILARVATVLLASGPAPEGRPGTVHVLRDGFELAEEEVRTALAEPLGRLRDRWGDRLRETTLRELGGDGLKEWCVTYCLIQWAEVRSCLGAWVDAAKPDFGPVVSASFALTTSLDRSRVAKAIERREGYYRHLRGALGPRDLVIMPTSPWVAPLKGALTRVPQQSAASVDFDSYPWPLDLTSIAGIGRLPELSMPLGEAGGVPVGLSLLGARGEDAFVLGVASILAK